MEALTGPQKRRRRYRRDGDDIQTFVMQPRDFQIVEVVAAHRAISSEELQMLVDGSKQQILRRLQLLFRAGWLDRPRSQRLTNGPMVYALGQRGAQHLGERTRTPNSVDWSEKNRQASLQFIEHALMISRFRTALTLAVGKSGGAVTLESWAPDGAFREAVSIPSKEQQLRVPIAPDAVIKLRVHIEPAGNVTACLEADRSTMDIKRFTQKLFGYFEFWRSGRGEERLGAKNFLVVTVTKSADRATHLRNACRQQLGDRTRMFLFTDESRYLPLDSGQILEPIWDAASGGVHSLIE